MDVDFYTLERPVQDRFADATRSVGVPSPIVREAAGARTAAFWWLFAVTVLGALVASLLRGVGDPNSRLVIAPPLHAALYLALAALSTFAVLRALALREARVTRPYEPGLYLFPAGVFDARVEPIRVYRHPELRAIEAVGATLRVGAESQAFVFRLPDARSAEQARLAFQEAAQKYDEAVRHQNRREQAMLDPLVDSGFASPFSSHQRLTREAPLWIRLAPLLALAAGAGVGPALWKVRNVISEQRLYAAVRARDDIDGYRAYIERGGPRAEVPDVLLPRAELRKAVAVGTVEALEEYVGGHPGSKIQAEVDTALHQAVGAELAAAQKVGTVTALREFQKKRHRYAFVAPAVDAATVVAYKRFLSTFLPGKSPQVASFYERILGYTKVHGPHAVVRLVRRLPESVEQADGLVKRSAYFMGKESIPSQYFKGDFAERREKPVAARLAALANAGFPEDVLHVEPGPTVTEDQTPEAPTEPTLFVEYAPEMAGGYMSPKPRGVFVGVGMTVKASFQIPGDTQPLELKFSIWRAPNPQVLKNEGATIADVYDKMANDGFDKFLKSYASMMSAKD